MLRLERGRSKEINIILNNSISLWDNIFCKALLLALGMHLTAFSLFYIHNIIFSSETIFPPVLVEIDRNLLISENEAQMSTQFEEVKYVRHSLMPKASDPVLPSINLKIDPIKFEYLSGTDQLANPFISIEELPDDYLTPLPSQKAAIELFIAGPLAEIPINAHLDQYLLTPNLVFQKNIYTYEVRVKADTGKIFWYTAKGIVVDSESRIKAEQILNDLQFQLNSNTFSVEGEITIVFNQSVQAIR